MFVLPSFGSGGAERVVLLLAAGTHAAGHPTTVVAFAGTGPLRHMLPPEIEVIDLGRRRARHALGPLIRVVRQRRPDVLMSSQTHVNAMIGLCRPLIGTRTRLVVRESELLEARSWAHRVARMAQRTAYRGTDLVIASSDPMAELLARRHRGRIAILPNPVETASLRSVEPDCGAPSSGRLFVHVGRLVPGKAVPELVDAFATGSEEDDRLLIVGDGPLRNDVERAIQRHGLSDRVELLGFVAAPEAFVASADALLLASRTEGMPNVVLEALALGTPVIATTDLITLDGLARNAPPGAVRLVPRDGLAEAIRTAPRATGRPAGRGPSVLRPSLLPPEHDVVAVTRGFVELVDEVASARHPAERLHIIFLSIAPLRSHLAPAVQVTNMAQAFAELDHDVTVIAGPDDPNVAEVDAEDLFGFLPRFRSWVPARRVHRGQSYVNALRIARFVRKVPAPVLVYSRNLRGCLIPALRGTPTIFEAHTLTSLDRPQERWVLRRLVRARGFRGVVAISAALARDLSDVLGIDPRCILVAHDAVRLGPAAPTRPGPQLRVGYTGSLFPGKGAETLIETASLCPWARFELAGGPLSLAERLELTVEERGLTNVVIHGPLTPRAARALQSDCDVLVAPFARRIESDSGDDISAWTSPMKLFEYLGSGRPMIVSDLPVLREVVTDEVNALLVPPEDPEALAAALRRLADDPGLRERLARTALAQAQAEHTWEIRARRVLARFAPDFSHD